MSSATSARITTVRRPGHPQVAGAVLGSWPRRFGFALTAAVITVGYTLLLPFEFTQRFGWRNWQFLTGQQLAWSLVLGIGMAFVLSVQVYAMRRIAAGRTGTLTGVALVGSLLPSFLCCTPIIPTLLAFIGLSTVSVYGTTGTLQHFFATHQTQFFLASLALLALSGWWGLRQVARSTCWTDDGCAVPQATADGDRDSDDCCAVDTSPVPTRSRMETR